eukprot:3571359-Rhodomonas_salina.3
MAAKSHTLTRLQVPGTTAKSNTITCLPGTVTTGKDILAWCQQTDRSVEQNKSYPHTSKTKAIHTYATMRFAPDSHVTAQPELTDPRLRAAPLRASVAHAASRTPHTPSPARRCTCRPTS